MLSDVVIPTLPFKSASETIEFYSRLGFQTGPNFEQFAEYLILRRETIELHFFHLPEIVPTESYGGCYWRVTDVDALFQEFAAQDLPSVGIPRLGLLEDKPWGMREFYFVDPSGNLIRIGQPIL